MIDLRILNCPCISGINSTWSWCMISLFYMPLLNVFNFSSFWIYKNNYNDEHVFMFCLLILISVPVVGLWVSYSWLIDFSNIIACFFRGAYWYFCNQMARNRNFTSLVLYTLVFLEIFLIFILNANKLLIFENSLIRSGPVFKIWFSGQVHHLI